MPLAMAEGANRQLGAALWRQRHTRPFKRLPARGFDEIAKPNAAQLAALQGFRAPCCEAIPIGEFHCHILGFREAPGINHIPRDIFIGDLIRADVIASADFIAPNAEGRRTLVKQAFQHIGGLGPTRAAIGIGRHCIRENATHLHIQRLKVIDRAIDAPARHGGHARAEIQQISAHRGQGSNTHANRLGILIKRHFGMRHMVPPMRV